MVYFGAIQKYCHISVGNIVNAIPGGVKKEPNSVCLALGHDTQTQTHTNSHADSNANMDYCDVLITVWQAGRQTGHVVFAEFLEKHFEYRIY